MNVFKPLIKQGNSRERFFHCKLSLVLDQCAYIYDARSINNNNNINQNLSIAKLLFSFILTVVCVLCVYVVM